MTKSILIAGVGGQGTLLASRIIGCAALNRGYDVKVSEVHGMAQRGGSVVTHVRYGENVFSPLVEEGTADLILAFELLEAARYAHYLKPDGIIIANAQRILPMPVITGKAKYPPEVAKELSAKFMTEFINALDIARSCGSDRTVNTVLLGAASKYLEFSDDEWREALKCTIKKQIEANLDAFTKGCGATPCHDL